MSACACVTGTTPPQANITTVIQLNQRSPQSSGVVLEENKTAAASHSDILLQLKTDVSYFPNARTLAYLSLILFYYYTIITF